MAQPPTGIDRLGNEGEHRVVGSVCELQKRRRTPSSFREGALRTTDRELLVRHAALVAGVLLRSRRDDFGRGGGITVRSISNVRRNRDLRGVASPSSGYSASAGLRRCCQWLQARDRCW